MGGGLVDLVSNRRAMVPNVRRLTLVGSRLLSVMYHTSGLPPSAQEKARRIGFMLVRIRDVGLRRLLRRHQNTRVSSERASEVSTSASFNSSPYRLACTSRSLRCWQGLPMHSILLRIREIY